MSRVIDHLNRKRQISYLADIVWNQFRRQDPSVVDRKIVIGWSTGGLAAYQMAHNNNADAVVLIAPALSIWLPPKSLDFNDSDNPLATDPGWQNQEVEPARPKYPFEMPIFLENLIRDGFESHSWNIPANIQGIALLAGANDRWVNDAEDAKVLAENAPQFQITPFPSSSHWIENDTPDVRDEALATIKNFLDQLN